jgi:hypothetical protein
MLTENVGLQFLSLRQFKRRRIRSSRGEFQVREAHLDTLLFVMRPCERFCRHLAPCDVAGILVKIARDLARVSRVTS